MQSLKWELQSFVLCRKGANAYHYHADDDGDVGDVGARMPNCGRKLQNDQNNHDCFFGFIVIDRRRQMKVMIKAAADLKRYGGNETSLQHKLWWWSIRLVRYYLIAFRALTQLIHVQGTSSYVATLPPPCAWYAAVDVTSLFLCALFSTAN